MSPDPEVIHTSGEDLERIARPGTQWRDTPGED